jgi:hypothetical protein
MNLKQNSISAKLYRWFYNQQTMPESLCPYFWKLLLMWVFILPYAIISLPTIWAKQRQYYTTFEKFGVGLFAWFLLGMVICMLSWVGLLFFEPVKDSFWWSILAVGMAGWIAILGVGIALFIEKLEYRNIERDEYGFIIRKQKKESIIVVFIKAKYNKYCPKITWE